MIRNDLDALDELEQAATKGPLLIEEPFDEHVSVVIGENSAQWVFVADFPYGKPGEYDCAVTYEQALSSAQAYVALRNAYPALAAEIRELRAIADLYHEMKMKC